MSVLSAKERYELWLWKTKTKSDIFYGKRSKSNIKGSEK